MNHSTECTPIVKGQIVCRPTSWTDVITFFALNYGLHAVTIVSVPGIGTIATSINIISALLLPFSGICTALAKISRFTWSKSDDLHTAQRAGALCMVVPMTLDGLKISIPRLAHTITEIHGQYPVLTNPLTLTTNDGNECLPPAEYILVTVPRSFQVSPLKGTGSTHLRLCSNYNLLKAAAGIIQVLYGSLKLYEASKRQLPKFGYASYSLTVIPYMTMSLINLLATLCEPHYPSMYLVLYGGFGTPPLAYRVLPGAESSDSIALQIAPEDDNLPAQCDALKAYIGGAVGEAVGEAYGGELPSRREMGTVFTRQFPELRRIRFRPLTTLAGLCCMAAPFILILLLTGFKPGQSTQSQRGWAMAWLAVGQYAGLWAYLSHSDERTQGELFHLFLSLVYGIPALGGFVIVGQMMIRDEVCTVI